MGLRRYSASREDLEEELIVEMDSNWRAEGTEL
jgi:hypothetical protein